MPTKQAPIDIILKGLLAITLAADVHEIVGFETPFKVRHQRHRYAQRQDRPCISFRLVNLARDEERQTYHTSSEVCWAAEIDIIVDLELPPESATIDADATGWNNLAVTANEVMKLFVEDASPIKTIVDDVLTGDTDPDEETKPDEGRLAQGIIVLYRTLFSDPNHLLSPEENGL